MGEVLGSTPGFHPPTKGHSTLTAGFSQSQPDFLSVQVRPTRSPGNALGSLKRGDQSLHCRVSLSELNPSASEFLKSHTGVPKGDHIGMQTLCCAVESAESIT